MKEKRDGWFWSKLAIFENRIVRLERDVKEIHEVYFPYYRASIIFLFVWIALLTLGVLSMFWWFVG